MEGNIELGLEVFVLGLITVFVVLYIVVQSGNLVISFVNRFIGAPPVIASVGSNRISSAKLAVITQAVLTVTEGKGRVETVEKV